MFLPTQSQPINRNVGFTLSEVSNHKNVLSGVEASACGAENTGQGQCFSLDGPIPGSFNCAACCAFRVANHWQGDNGTVAVC
jgi:hypothetical protein